MKLLSIIIPAYNRPANLDILLNSIAEAEKDFVKKIEVIVSDDSPQPSPLPVIIAKYTDIFRMSYWIL